MSIPFSLGDYSLGDKGSCLSDDRSRQNICCLKDVESAIDFYLG